MLPSYGIHILAIYSSRLALTFQMKLLHKQSQLLGSINPAKSIIYKSVLEGKWFVVLHLCLLVQLVTFSAAHFGLMGKRRKGELIITSPKANMPV